jgi:hypothetical protein
LAEIIKPNPGAECASQVFRRDYRGHGAISDFPHIHQNGMVKPFRHGVKVMMDNHHGFAMVPHAG